MMLHYSIWFYFFVLRMASSVSNHEHRFENERLKSRGLLQNLLGNNPGAGNSGIGGIFGGVTNLLGPGPGSLLSPAGGPLGILGGPPTYNPVTSTAGPRPAQIPGDAPWTQAEAAYQRMITCPMGITGQRGIVLLLPPTALNAAETWSKTLFAQQLPRYGFAICWVDNPTESVGDIQLTAEFVAYAIRYLAMISRRPINLISWSQGGINASWALVFWPSLRSMVAGFVAIASPWRGTVSGNLICGPLALVGGCLPALLQQAANSNAIRALNAPVSGSAIYALVPTTSIYTLMDEVVTPQTGSMPASALPGASNIALQQICGAGHIADHFSIPNDPATYSIALSALLSGRPANPANVDRSSCNLLAGLRNQIGSLGNDLKATFNSVIGNPGDRIGSILRTATTLRVPSEPPLQLYVCQRGFATGCSGNGFSAGSGATVPLLSQLPQTIQAIGPLLGGLL